MGFIILTILFIIIGFAYERLPPNGLLALYVLALVSAIQPHTTHHKANPPRSQFFFNFGPNATTFIIPGECFPTRYRSTSHGFSAASGKVGAIIAQVLIGPLRVRGNPTADNPSPWLNHVMEIYALFMFLGIFFTALVPETKRKTLEELAGEVPGTALYDPISAGHEGRRYPKDGPGSAAGSGSGELRDEKV